MCACVVKKTTEHIVNESVPEFATYQVKTRSSFASTLRSAGLSFNGVANTVTLDVGGYDRETRPYPMPLKVKGSGSNAYWWIDLTEQFALDYLLVWVKDWYTRTQLTQVTETSVIRFRYSEKVKCGVDNFRKLKASGCMIINPYDTFEFTFKASPPKVKEPAFIADPSGVSYLRNNNYKVANFPNGGGILNVYGLSCGFSASASRPGPITYPSVLQLMDYVKKNDNTDPFVISEAESNRHKKVNNADFELLATLAEGPETVKYIYSKLLTLYKILRAFRNGSYKQYARETYKKMKREMNKNQGAFNAMSLFSSFWLEARFAIRPLIIDIDNAVKTLNRDKSIHDRYRFVGGSETELYKDIDDLGGLLSGVSYHSERTSSARSGTIMQMLDETDINIAFGLSNIAGAVWEKIPYSWLLSYMFDVSTLLGRLSPNSSFEEMVRWNSSKCYVTAFGSIGSSAVAEQDKVLYSTTWFHFQRQETPALTFVHADAHTMDAAKLTDIVALLFQLGAGKKVPGIIT